MKWIKKLLGRTYPEPEVGQIWQGGSAFRVCALYKPDMVVSVQYRRANNGTWGLPLVYSRGLTDWNRRLREEKRVLSSVTDIINPSI